MDSDANNPDTAPDRSAADPPPISEEHRWFEALVDYTKSRVYSLIRRRISNAATADELVQQTLLNAWRGRSTFDREKNELTWIRSIARNTVFDYLRALQANKRDTPCSLDRIHGDYQESDGISLAPPVRQPLKPVDRLIIMEAIQQLEEHELEMFELQQMGFSYAEIGAKIGKPETAIGPALTRIRKKLGLALADYKNV